MIEENFSPGYAPGDMGPVHYVTCGSGEPLVMLHQSPRSWRECRFIMEALGRNYRAVAIDLPGFGASAALEEHTIQSYARGVLQVVDFLRLDRFAVLGHHTGGVVATELGASASDRVLASILSCTPYIDAEERARRRASVRPIDSVTWRDSGEHVLDLWRSRASFYGKKSTGLVDDFVADALLHGERYRDGHFAVSRYHMDERLTYEGPILMLGADADPYSFSSFDRLMARLPRAESHVLRGGTFTILEERSREVSEKVHDFLGNKALSP